MNPAQNPSDIKKFFWNYVSSAMASEVGIYGFKITFFQYLNPELKEESGEDELNTRILTSNFAIGNDDPEKIFRDMVRLVDEHSLVGWEDVVGLKTFKKGEIWN